MKIKTPEGDRAVRLFLDLTDATARTVAAKAVIASNTGFNLVEKCKVAGKLDPEDFEFFCLLQPRRVRMRG